MKRRFPGCLCLFMGSLFPLVGGSLAESQRQTLARGIEVPAEVVGHELKFHTDSDGDAMYGPVLKLRYLADGMPETGEGLLALEIHSSESWAQEKLAKYPVGKRITAWADPDHLERAFVEREASLFPYLFILFPMIFFCFGVMLTVSPPGEDKVYRPTTPWAGRSFLIAWIVTGVLSAAHYFSTPGSWNVAGVALFGVYLGFGMLPVLVKVRRWAVGESAATPRA